MESSEATVLIGANICEEDDSDDELAVAGNTEPEPFHERTIQIAMDSGAGKNVAPPEMVEGYQVNPSYGSSNNKHFVAANGGKILNLGECDLNFNDGSGSRMRSTFQIAEVSRMLYSVSQLCDAGCDVAFNKSEGKVTKNGKLLAKFPRRGGLYVMTTTLKSPHAHKTKPETKPDTGFAGQA
jgi:hypothetical protein